LGTMFLENKYSRWYFGIIGSAVARASSKSGGYFESHHIVPRSLGGKHSVDNRVLLTAKEHFVCHLLLCKMTLPGSKERYKMLHAFMLMKGENEWQRRHVGRSYERIKREYASYRSAVRAGQLLTEGHKNKISAALMGHSHITDAGRAVISAKAKARPRKKFTEQDRANISAGMRLARAQRLGTAPGRNRSLQD